MLRPLLLIYLMLINAAGFAGMLTDKHRSEKKQWRIPEKRLLLIAALGGSLGSGLGMLCARHKIRKPRFRYGIPLFLILHIFLLLKLTTL